MLSPDEDAALRAEGDAGWARWGKETAAVRPALDRYAGDYRRARRIETAIARVAELLVEAMREGGSDRGGDP